MSHLALPQTPRPSPPHPPGHRFSVAGSAGDTHQMPDLPSARSSWPETEREYTEKKRVEESSSRSKAREDAKMKVHSGGENKVPEELCRKERE